MSQIVVPVTNVSDRWLQLCAEGSSFQALDEIGMVRYSGDFFEHAAPNILRPGSTGYLTLQVGHPQDDPREYVDRVEVSPAYREVASQQDAAAISARWPTSSDIQTSTGPYGGVTATGQVTNPGDTGIAEAAVIAVFLDSKGRTLGFANGRVQALSPGATAPFRADAYFSEIALADIAETLVLVSDQRFECEAGMGG